MKVLVTGGDGQLGFEVGKRLDALGMKYKTIDLADCDLTNRAQTAAYVQAYKPDCVVHCAAYTAVDQAESHPDACRAVNVEGTRNIATACANVDASLVYISTDYIFTGEGNNPFETNAPKGPLNVYGQTKLMGEQAVAELLDRYFIVRTSWVFGQHGQNFVQTMLRLGRERKQLCVVDDQIGSPTYAVDLAVLLCNMLQTERYGVYHATNEGFCSWFTFAQTVMRQAGLTCEIRPVSTAEYPADAKRPLNSRLSKQSLIEAGFTLLPPWQDALGRYLVECNSHRQ